MFQSLSDGETATIALLKNLAIRSLFSCIAVCELLVSTKACEFTPISNAMCDPVAQGLTMVTTQQATNHSPMLFGVIVQAHLADGTKREFSVDLLHTILLGNTVSVTTLNEVSP